MQVKNNTRIHKIMQTLVKGKTEVDILISDTVDITAQKNIRDKEGHYIKTSVNIKCACTR